MKIPYIVSIAPSSRNILRINAGRLKNRKKAALTLAEEMRLQQQRSGHASVFMEASSRQTATVVYAAFKKYYELCPNGKAVLFVPDEQAGIYLEEAEALDQAIINRRQHEQENNTGGLFSLLHSSGIHRQNETFLRKKFIEDAERCQKMREKLKEIETIPFSENLSSEDKDDFRDYSEQAIDLLQKQVPVFYSVDTIDEKIDSIIDLLKNARSEGAGGQTIRICFAGIQYGLFYGKGEIPPHSPEWGVLDRREKILSRYLALALYSIEADSYYKKLDQHKKEGQQLIKEIESYTNKLNRLKMQYPDAYKLVCNMNSYELSTLNGIYKTIALTLKSVADLRAEVSRKEVLSGEMKQTIGYIKTSVNINMQILKRWEADIDSASILDFQRLHESLEYSTWEIRQFYLSKLEHIDNNIDSHKNNDTIGNKIAEIVSRYEHEKRKLQEEKEVGKNPSFEDIPMYGSGGFGAPLPQQVKKRERKRVSGKKQEPALSSPGFSSPPFSRELERLLENKDRESFVQRLYYYIDKRGMTDVQTYKSAHLDKRVFSKMRSRQDSYKPSKQTAVALAIGLKLTIDETKDLLSKAELMLSDTSDYDIIISFCIEKKIYNMYDVNEYLYAYNQPPFPMAN